MSGNEGILDLALALTSLEETLEDKSSDLELTRDVEQVLLVFLIEPD